VIVDIELKFDALSKKVILVIGLEIGVQNPPVSTTDKFVGVPPVLPAIATDL